jgi:hypothetical protein
MNVPMLSQRQTPLFELLRTVQWPLCAAVAIGSLMVSGCTSLPDQLASGMPRSEVLRRLGQPTAIYALRPSPANPEHRVGTRLQYSQQPAGVLVYNLDLDTSDKLVQRSQALQTDWLAKITAPAANGSWTAADVRLLLGEPAEHSSTGSFRGPIWTYRYEEIGFARQFHVYFDAQNTVVRTQSTDDLRRELRND